MALSLSMPVRGEAWSGRPVEAYIDGLLPDSMDVRTRIGNLYGVSPRNPFALLSAVGMDCGGAVQFITEEQLMALPLPEVWNPSMCRRSANGWAGQVRQTPMRGR